MRDVIVYRVSEWEVSVCGELLIVDGYDVYVVRRLKMKL